MNALLFVGFILFGQVQSSGIESDFQNAKAAFEQRDYVMAATLCTAILKADESRGDAAAMLGQIYFFQNNLDEAEKWLKHAIKHGNNDSMTNLWLGRTYGRKAQSANIFRKPGLAKKC